MEEKVKERTSKLSEVNKELSQLHEIIELSENPILITDIDDNITFWNKGAENTYGYQQKEAIQSNRPDLLKMKFDKPYEEIKKEILEMGVWVGEATAVSKKGKTVTLLTQITVLDGKDGKPLSILEIAQDITHRKEMEKEINKYNQELKEINEAKDKIFSVISHDLRNPVTGIVSSSEILKSNIDTFKIEQTKEFINVIYRSANKLLLQLNELVIWAKSTDARVTYNPNNERLYSVINDALSLIRLNASQKNIKIENATPEDLFVFADSNMLKSIIQNLIK